MGGGRAFAREEIRGEFFLFFFFSFFMVYQWDGQQSPGCGKTGSSWWKGERGGWALDITYDGVFFAVPSNVFVAAPLAVC